MIMPYINIMREDACLLFFKDINGNVKRSINGRLIRNEMKYHEIERYTRFNWMGK